IWFTFLQDDEHISTVPSPKSNINPNVSINNESDDIIHTNEELMVDQQSNERNMNLPPLTTVDAQPMSTIMFQRQEFMAIQRAQCAAQLSSGFNPTTVGHHRSVTAMVAPPLQLRSASDLLKETVQYTPASLVATHADQPANNQKKEIQKQLLLVSNAIEHQDQPSTSSII
ncbi:unnamed protein product, partial [Didymodactylos carnosus]